ncbi:MAG TPA: hypothetical protein DCZ75_10960 [Geobacter sp.]|nr:hypothetical protein [Geobacter sp.]
MIKRNIFKYIVILVLSLVLASCSSSRSWHTQAYYGNTDSAKKEILRQKDISSVGPNGENPLLWGSRIGDAELVSRLLESGAEVNYSNQFTGETPLILAAKNGHIDVLRILIKNGADTTFKDKSGNNALESAIEANKIDLINVLAVSVNHLKTNDKNILLVNAARFGDANTVQNLLSSGAAINFQTNEGESALIAAAKSSNAELIKLLINQGANLEAKDISGRTALILASQANCLDCCEALISSGADINTKDARQNTPIMWVIVMNQKEVFAKLLNNRADVTQKNVSGKNALYLAAFNSDIAKEILCISHEVPEVTVEGDNYYDLALSYDWLAKFIERELVEKGKTSIDIISNLSFAYSNAAKYSELTANQYVDLASSLRTKQVLSVVGAALLNAASQTAASYDANRQAKQMADFSALKSAASGGSGKGVGYGMPMYTQITPGTSNWDAAKISDTKAVELKRLAKVYREKADCYDKVKVGQEKTCVQRFGSVQ